MDIEKFKMVTDYFIENGINLPTDVKNSIQDVFEENDNIDRVECYHKYDIEELKKDLMLKNTIHININGSSAGTTMSTWSYYGAVEFSLSEEVLLTNDESVIEVISDFNNTSETYFYNENEYAVILVEITNWKTPGEIKKEDVLYIYCPKDIDETSDNHYEEIYQDIKGGNYGKL